MRARALIYTHKLYYIKNKTYFLQNLFQNIHFKARKMKKENTIIVPRTTLDGLLLKKVATIHVQLIL